MDQMMQNQLEELQIQPKSKANQNNAKTLKQNPLRITKES
jgi:hypothetical protein